MSPGCSYRPGRENGRPHFRLILTAFLALHLAEAARPAEIIVNSLADNTTPGDGLVTLREAIIAANDDATTDLGETASGNDTIVILWLSGTITLTEPLPTIRSDMWIWGAGINEDTIDGGGVHRVFVIESGAVVISDLTVTNGAARGGDGGNGYGGGGGGAGLGGAVFVNSGFVDIQRMVFVNNVAVGGNGGAGSLAQAGGGGGGIGGSATDSSGQDGGTGGDGTPLNGTAGAGANHLNPADAGGNGGEGAGGGGGDHASPSGNGGNGGFGGGGGGADGVVGGNGGFGGGSGAPGGSPGTFGGAPGARQGGGGAGLGGAIFVRAGTVNLFECAFDNNSATGGSGGTAGQGKGGAIFNNGAVVRASSCTYSGNTASDALGSGNDTNDVYGTIPEIPLPAVTSIIRLNGNPSNVARVAFRVTFNQFMQTVLPDDFVLTTTGTIAGCSINALTVYSGASTDVIVDTGAGEGTIRLDLPDYDTVINVTGEPLGGWGLGNGDYTGGESYTIDRSGPTITLASTATARTNTSIPVTVTLTEASTNFDADDVTVTNATLIDFAGSGTNYSFTLTPAAEGTLSVLAVAGVCGDALGNPNTQSNTLTRVYDITPPTVALGSTAPDPTDSEIPVVITLSEESSTFAAEDVNVVNGVVTDFFGSGSNYTFWIVPAGTGLVTAVVNAAAFTDAAGNGNASGSNTLAVTYNQPAPSVILSTTAPDPTNAVIPVTATLSASSVNFTAGDISVGNANIVGFTGGAANYSFTLVPAGAGTVSVAVAAGAFTNGDGLANTASNTLTRVYDPLGPSIELASSAATVTNAPIPVSVALSEACVFGLDALTVTNASVTSLSGANASYTFTLTPLDQGEVSVAVAASAFTDPAGNPNPWPAVLSRVYDTVAPTVISVTPVATQITDAESVEFVVAFSEPVTGFEEPADVSVVVEGVGYSGVTFTPAGANTYAVAVGGLTGAGTLRLMVREAVASDAAGNLNVASIPSTQVNIGPSNPPTGDNPPTSDNPPSSTRSPVLCGPGFLPPALTGLALLAARSMRRRR